MAHHTDILMNTAHTLRDRTEQYGSPSEAYQRAAAIASVTTGKQLTHYDIVMVMHAVKLSRMVTGRGNLDHYEDAINYLAFAAEFATEEA